MFAVIFSLLEELYAEFQVTLHAKMSMPDLQWPLKTFSDKVLIRY